MELDSCEEQADRFRAVFVRASSLGSCDPACTVFKPDGVGIFVTARISGDASSAGTWMGLEVDAVNVEIWRDHADCDTMTLPTFAAEVMGLGDRAAKR